MTKRRRWFGPEPLWSIDDEMALAQVIRDDIADMLGFYPEPAAPFRVDPTWHDHRVYPQTHRYDPNRPQYNPVAREAHKEREARELYDAREAEYRNAARQRLSSVSTFAAELWSAPPRGGTDFAEHDWSKPPTWKVPEPGAGGP